MRPLESFLHRRKIKDPEQWLQRMGIRSQLALETWCENNEIEAPELGKYFPAPDASEDEAPSSTNRTKAEQPSNDEEETWHIPAAERPRKQPAKRPATKKRKTSASKKK